MTGPMTSSMTRRIIAVVIAAVSIVAILAGCTRSVAGTAVHAGPGDSQRQENSAQQYPNLLKECDVLDSRLIAKTVGADPADIQSTFVGAVCRWQAANPAGLIDITRSWFEQGSLDNERKAAEKLKYQIQNRSIAGVESILMRTNDANGACGVASAAGGVVGWWVNPQRPGVDACRQAVKLMEMTLVTNS
jgi:Protein of unknown function (DUF3558)